MGQPIPGANDSRNTNVLIAGIVAVVCCALAGIYAIIVGNQLKKEYGAIPSPANIGYILGIVGLAIQGLVLVVYVAIFMIAILGSSS